MFEHNLLILLLPIPENTYRTQNGYSSKFFRLNLNHIPLKCLKKPNTFLERGSALEIKTVLILVKFPYSPILHYAFSSWIEKTMTKTIRCQWETDLFCNSMGLCGNFTLIFLSLPLYISFGKFMILQFPELSMHIVLKSIDVFVARCSLQLRFSKACDLMVEDATS